MRSFLGLLLLLAASPTGAAGLQENFSSDPAAAGWNIFGNTNLFSWDATNQNLRVTWDSSQANSYFHHPLPTILAKDDDFSLAFDLRLDDIVAGADTNKPSTFQIAIALLNIGDAIRPNLLRGTGINETNGPRNSIEFDYFPDSGFGATVSPTIVSSNNQFASSFTFPLELTVNDWFHIEMTYTASNQTLATVMTRNGQPFGPVQNTTLDPGFSDFRVGTVAVCSFNDEGQFPPEFAGSVLAHGVVDNIVVTTPPPPVMNLTGSFGNAVWTAQFTGRSNWLYTLVRSTDFQVWTNVPPSVPGVSGTVLLSDSNTPPGKAFYRVKAERP